MRTKSKLNKIMAVVMAVMLVMGAVSVTAAEDAMEVTFVTGQSGLTTEEQLREAIAGADPNTPTTIVLGGDIALTSVVQIPVDADITLVTNQPGGVTLTVNGSFRHFNVLGELSLGSATPAVNENNNITLTRADGNTGNGGGVHAQGGTFTMHGGVITNNHAQSTTTFGGGGGVWVQSRDWTTHGSFIMHGGEITGNSTNDSGGGVNIAANNGFVMHGGLIARNTAGAGSVSGGGVYIGGPGQGTMNGGVIRDNEANSGSQVAARGAFTLNDGIIADTTATDRRAAIEIQNDRLEINGGVVFGVNINTYTTGVGIVGLVRVIGGGGSFVMPDNGNGIIIAWRRGAGNNYFIANSRHALRTRIEAAEFAGHGSLAYWTINGGVAAIANNRNNLTVNIYDGVTMFAGGITEVAITGITAPAVGQTPTATAAVTTVSPNFTPSNPAVTWSPNHSSFQREIPYTASVTLTANAGFAFGEMRLVLCHWCVVFGDDGCDSCSYELAPALTTATINGQAAVATIVSPTQITLSYEFEQIGALQTGNYVTQIVSPVPHAHNINNTTNEITMTVRNISATQTVEVHVSPGAEWALFASRGNAVANTSPISNKTVTLTHSADSIVYIRVVAENGDVRIYEVTITFEQLSGTGNQGGNGGGNQGGNGGGNGNGGGRTPVLTPTPTPPSTPNGRNIIPTEDGQHQFVIDNEAFIQMDGDTLKLSRADLLRILEEGLSIRISLDIPEGRAPMHVLLPLEFILMLIEEAEAREDESFALLVTVEDFFLDDVFSSAVITITTNDGEQMEFATHYYVYANLAAVFDFEGVNTHRIVAQMLNPVILGGRFDAETGYFTVAVTQTGSFAIRYVETLNRLTSQLDSPYIIDLAGNTPMQVMDVLPVIIDGRTLLPLRFVAYVLGAEVDWIQPTEDTPSTALIVFNGQELRIPLNGTITPELAALGMDVPAQLIDDRTMVPLRFVGELFGAIVNWDSETRSIEIIRNSANPTSRNPNHNPQLGRAMQSDKALSRQNTKEDFA